MFKIIKSVYKRFLVMGGNRLLVSVIVPVYNVEKYISKCIDSIISQNYKNIEIIIINDGSTDKSVDICYKYQKMDPRIKIINQENSGLMSAWIKGVEICKGEYVTFVDSDDWISENMIYKFIKCLKNEKYDLIISNHIQEYVNNKIKIREKCSSGAYNEELINDKIYTGILYNGEYFGRNINLCRWGKLIKRSILIENIKYCDTRISYGEDVNIMFPVFLDCKKIYILEDYLYHYRQEQDSIMHKYKKNMQFQIKKLNKILNLVNREKNIFDFKNQIYNNFLCMNIALIRNELERDISIGNKIRNVIQIINLINKEKVFQNNSLSNLSVTNKYIVKTIISNKRVAIILFVYLYNLKMLFYSSKIKKLNYSRNDM